MWFFQPFNEVNQTVRKGKRYEKISAADTFWIFLLYLSKVHKENIQCSHLQLKTHFPYALYKHQKYNFPETDTKGNKMRRQKQ